ncbi:MAG: hypothetical protein INR73_24515 [Williamsia sp.]|nr:hypothetical protein [Williamsia sp.]
MTLDEQEYHQYVAAHMKLLYYVGIEEELISPATTLEAFYKLPFQRKYQCREAMYKNMHLLDSYLSKYAEQLHPGERHILQGFKKKIQSDFIILKCLTRYCIFVDCKTDLMYAVKALSDPFDEFFRRFPVYCTTAILPFKDTIIYDGFISTQGNVFLRPELSASMNEKYKQAKKNNTIVTSLQ